MTTMRPTVATVRPAFNDVNASAAALDSPMRRVALTAGVSLAWIGAYMLMTAKALQLI
jgi:hypothetical protein